ncbi:transmembrane emp24 domain-containing protein 7-like protein [Euroglyphus maynei]|uniref:Transmembrane emp24 domain-containing protein 7-like protein n=1 Tax=Euroglyphus maynei TaxID=6958 RepID=A0A1Y3BV64_EURMA|nr:transmembrane emp24 domain-containing protein 7-like protein [Euroglyphus maynei]
MHYQFGHGTHMLVYCCHILLLSIICRLSLAVELTFELPDNAKQCFHEDIRQGVESTVEFQVVTGGKYDVDMKLTGPRGEVLYEGHKKQFDTFKWTPAQTGTYTICFSNEFSTFSHKLVYFDFQVGEEAPLPGTQHVSVMTKMEQSAANIHENLNNIMDHQKHYRLNEAKGRKRAEELNTRVMTWSLFETCVVLIIGVGQVMILKNFFTERRSAIAAT